MTSALPNLSTMPAIVLELVMKNVNLKEIQTLRKVCRHLRSFIKTVQFDPKIEKINVSEFSSNTITSKLYCENQEFEITYLKYREGCLVEYSNKRKYLENQDFATVAGNDLGMILRHQKTKINEIQLHFHQNPKQRLSIEGLETGHGRFLSSLEPHLKSRKYLLPLKEIEICGTHQEIQFMKILQYVEPKTLTHIEIKYLKSRWQISSVSFKMDRIVELDQWKQARHLNIDGLNVTSSLRNFANFDYGHFEMKEVSAEDLIFFKQAILQHDPSGRHHFCIDYRHLIDKKNFLKLIGRPYPNEDNNVLQWYYRFPDSDRALDFNWQENRKKFAFHPITATNAPVNAFN